MTGQVLTVKCYFRLPDDFEGSLVDALQLLVDYEAENLGESITAGGPIGILDDHWPDFIKNAFADNGPRFTGGINVAQWADNKLVAVTDATDHIAGGELPLITTVVTPACTLREWAEGGNDETP